MHMDPVQKSLKSYGVLTLLPEKVSEEHKEKRPLSEPPDFNIYGDDLLCRKDVLNVFSL